jgi:tetratricopeptide (TPR) repeat protein
MGKVRAGIRKLEKLDVPFGEKAAAWATFLQDLAEKKRWDVLRRVSKRHPDEFRAHPETWSAVGYALLLERREPEVVAWFRDWRERRDEMTAINLLNLAAALDGTGDPDAAREVREEALGMFPSDDDAGNFRAGLAWSMARAGEVEAAEAHLAEIEADRMMEFYEAVALLARAMLAARRGDEEEAMEKLTQGTDMLGDWKTPGSARNYVEGAAEVLAEHLAWAKGKRRKVLRKLAGNGGLTWGKHWWWILPGVWVIYQLVKAVASAS